MLFRNISTDVHSQRHSCMSRKDNSLFVPILRTVTFADNTHVNGYTRQNECCHASDLQEIKFTNAKVGPEFFENKCVGNKVLKNEK